MPVNEIDSLDVLEVLKPLWTSRQVMGRKVRRRIKAVSAWALSAKHITVNPAGESLDGALPKQNGGKHLRALPWREIPAARMKSRREHRVPLSDAALAELEAVRVLDDGSGLIFPSPLKRGKPLSDMTLTKILRDTGLAERATVHGFRSSFSDWCADTGKRREDAEAALAHVVGGVEGAYFRSDLFARRRVLMEQWAAFATQQDAQVESLRPAKTLPAEQRVPLNKAPLCRPEIRDVIAGTVAG